MKIFGTLKNKNFHIFKISQVDIGNSKRGIQLLYSHKMTQNGLFDFGNRLPVNVQNLTFLYP